MHLIPWGNDGNLTDEQFYNRTEDISIIKSLLKTTEYGTAPTILLSGIRGVGKTALLKKIKKELEEEYLIAYVDLTQNYTYQIGNLNKNGLMEQFFNSWIIELNEKKLNPIAQKIKKVIKTKKIKLSDIMDVSGYPVPILESETNPKELLDFVIELPQKIYDKNKDKIKGVIFIIDEFQALNDLGKNLKSFLWFFRSYIQNQKNVAYIFSGSVNSNDSIIDKIAGPKGAFGGRVLSVKIEPFSKETVKTYLNKGLTNLKFSNDGFERFYKCTKGIPHYVNTFAKLLTKDTLLTEEMVKNEFINCLPFLADQLKQKWGGLTLREQKIIICLLEKPLKRKEIGDKFNQKSSSLSAPLNKLLNDGFLEIQEDGKYAINEHILKEWLKQEYKYKGVFPYRSE